MEKARPSWLVVTTLRLLPKFTAISDTYGRAWHTLLANNRSTFI